MFNRSHQFLHWLPVFRVLAIVELAVGVVLFAHVLGFSVFPEWTEDSAPEMQKAELAHAGEDAVDTEMSQAETVAMARPKLRTKSFRERKSRPAHADLEAAVKPADNETVDLASAGRTKRPANEDQRLSFIRRGITAGYQRTVEAGGKRLLPALDRQIIRPHRVIEGKPHLPLVQAGHWMPFGGTYFRLWGGAKTGSLPKGVVVGPSGEHVYVTNFGQKDELNVYRYDSATLEVDRLTNFPGLSIESVFSVDGRRLFVSNFSENAIMELDARSLRHLRTMKVGRMPKHFAASADGRTLYVSNWASNDVSILDLRKGEVQATIPVGLNPRGTVLHPNGKTLYVGNFSSGTLSVIDLETFQVRKTLQACRSPRHGAITQDGKSLFFSCYGAGIIFRFDTDSETIVQRLWVGRGPKTLELSKDERYIYTADYNGSSFTVVDRNKWVSQTIPVPTVKTSGLAVSPDDRWIYLTGFDSLNLLVMERLLPAEKEQALGPRAPERVCYRKDPAACMRFP